MRIAVLALDGFPYYLLQELGPKLPNLSRLLSGGTWGKLVSTVPFVTATAWTSFMTGKNPGKHGVLGFFSRTSNDPAVAGELVAGYSIKDQTIWGALSRSGQTVGVFGVPMTYKPEAVNGFLISGFPLPRHATDYTYPIQLRESLESKGWNFADVPTQAYSKAELDPFYEELKVRVKQKTDAVLYLLERFKSDFFMVHYFETDKLLHEFLNFRYPKHCSPDDYKKYGTHVDDFVLYLDQQLGRVLEALPGTANVLVVSDHGLSPGNHIFLTDTWLLKERYIKVRNRPVSVLRYVVFRLGVTPELAFRILPGKASGLLLKNFMGEHWEMEKPKGASASEFVGRLLYRLLLDKSKDIDWKRSAAYSFGGYGVATVYLVAHGDAQKTEELRTQIVSRLRSLSFNGAPVFDEVLLDKDVYRWEGDNFDIPDILAYDDESEYVALTNPSFFTSNKVITSKYSNKDEANHDRNGIYVACGPEMSGLGDDSPLDIMDMFPTILHYFGCAIDPAVDGKIAKGLFRAGTDAATREPVFAAPVLTGDLRVAFSKEEESDMLDKLRRMGYV